ncbi:MAG: VOC family protein [Thermoplasmata archaeon]|nr:VOC family protein [Thermoplasmata archaeon]
MFRPPLKEGARAEFQGGSQRTMRLLHTSVTVRNIDRSLAFYTKLLGLEFVRRRTIPENHAEIAFVRDPESGGEIELTCWGGKASIDPGEQLDHIAFAVPDLEAFLARARADGVTVAKEPFRLAGGSGHLAFVLDPDGIWIELIQRDGGGR